MKEEKFDPQRMQAIIDRLRAEGRLPSEEDFVRSALKIREKYRKEILDSERKRKVRRPGKD